MAWSAAATVAASVVSGAAQSSAAGKAAKAQQNAVNAANAQEQGFYNSTRDDLQPFITTGTNAAHKLSDLEGLNGSNIQATLQGLPGYQFANQQGLKSVQNSATSRGLGISGAAQKGAANYSTGLANQYYNNLLSGIQNTENTGEAAGASLGGVAADLGKSIGNNTVGAGNARAAADLAQGNAISGIGNSLLTGALYKGFGQDNGNPSSGSQYTTATDASPGLSSDWTGGFGSLGSSSPLAWNANSLTNF